MAGRTSAGRDAPRGGVDRPEDGVPQLPSLALDVAEPRPLVRLDGVAVRVAALEQPTLGPADRPLHDAAQARRSRHVLYEPEPAAQGG